MHTMAFATQLLWTIGAAAVVCVVLRLSQVLTQRSGGADVDRNYRVRGLPLVGVVPYFMSNFSRIHDWLVTYLEKHHTVTFHMLGTQECYFTCDIDNVKYMLKTNFDNFNKGGMFNERFHILLGDGVFNTDGDMWKLQRKTVMPEFTSRNLREFYAAAYTEAALKLSSLLDEINHQGVSVDLQPMFVIEAFAFREEVGYALAPGLHRGADDNRDLFLRMTLEAIGKVGFGVEIGCLPWQLPLPENAFAKAFDSAGETVSKRFVDSLWKVKRFLKVGLEGELLHHIDVIDSFTYGVIAQRKLEISPSSRDQQSNGVPQEEQKLDIMTRFLKLAEDEKNGVDCKLIRDICVNFVIAGRDTTAVTLSWLVYSLTQKPEMAQRLHEELRSFDSGNATPKTPEQTPPQTAAPAEVDKQIGEFAKLLTFAHLKTELPYLTAVISETLRLYPAVPQILKAVKENDVLPDGTRVNKGMIIGFSPYCMGRMTYIWGLDAKEFKPERWLHNGKFVMESEFKLTAFQAGARMCMGRDSAYTQMKITAAILYRFFQFQLVEDHPVEYTPKSVLVMANGLKVNVRRRVARSDDMSR